nr:DUF3742 family protein [Pseudomonas humi]
MKPLASISLAERLGMALGRVCRGYVRQERKMSGWLVGRGISAGGAAVVLWSVKLVVLGVLFYCAFWLTLLFLFAVAAAWAVQTGALENNGEQPTFVEDELSKLRQTPGYDPNLYNDTAHEMYTDDN